MQAVVVEDVGSYAFGEVDTPVAGCGEVLLEVAVTGVCRTDLKIIEVGHRDLALPRIPGEEVVGRIVSLGPDVDPDWEGRRAYVYPGTSCGQCPACIQDAGNLCSGMRIMGFHRDGGFAQFVVAPSASLIALPDDISDEEAVFAEPLSCCLNALELGRLAPGERVGIWGAGPAGTLLQRAARARGANPIVVEPDPRRRARAHGHASPPQADLDLAVVAVGSADAYEEAMLHLAPRGRLVVFSGLPREAATLPVDLNRLHYMEQTIVGAYGCAYRHGREAIELIRAGTVPVLDLVSHRLPLRELPAALRVIADRRGMKVLLYPW